MNRVLDNRNRFRKQGGFTLIELMIVVAIVAILAVVASASYRNQVVRSNRTAAASFMLELANREERFLLDNRKYATDTSITGGDELKALTGSSNPPDEVAGNYTVTVVDLDADDNTPDYKITATPKGAQDADDTTCGYITLDSTGKKESEFSGSRCWK